MSADATRQVQRHTIRTVGDGGVRLCRRNTAQGVKLIRTVAYNQRSPSQTLHSALQPVPSLTRYRGPLLCTYGPTSTYVEVDVRMWSNVSAC